MRFTRFETKFGGYKLPYPVYLKVYLTLAPFVPSMSPAGVAAAGALMLLAVGYAMRRRVRVGVGDTVIHGGR